MDGSRDTIFAYMLDQLHRRWGCPRWAGLLVVALALLLPATIAEAATLDIVGGALTFTDAGTENNTLTVSLGGGIYTFNDTATTITRGAGATAAGCSGSSTVSCPASAVTSTITINAGGGTNVVNLRSIASGDDTTVNGDAGTTAVNMSS